MFRKLHEIFSDGYLRLPDKQKQNQNEAKTISIRWTKGDGVKERRDGKNISALY